MSLEMPQERCLGCLKEVTGSPRTSPNHYCRVCIRQLWAGKMPAVPQDTPLSAVFPQEQYLIKSIPIETNLRFPEDKPANEHLTMQIARQLFKLSTAVNGLIMDEQRRYHYVAKRFDHSEGGRLDHKTFCEWMERSEETHGPDYQTGISYKALASLIQQKCQTPLLQLDRLFSWIIFSYCFGNGHGHLENISLIETKDGDYVLSPAYALICTAVHYPYDRPLGLSLLGHPLPHPPLRSDQREDFLQLGAHYGLSLRRIDSHLRRFKQSSPAINQLINRSFLSRPAQVVYRKIVEERIQHL